MTTPRTIDNLGVETSTRWAHDQSVLESALAKGSSAIPLKAEIDVTSPSYASEFDILFGEYDRHVTWANFIAPYGFFEQRKRLFTFQILPALGSEELLEAKIERIKAMQDQEEGREKPTFDWEEAREKEEQEKEKKILLTFFNSLHELNRFLIDINSKRIQYQKG